MANTLIVYELVPDETRIYLVPTLYLPEMLVRCLVVAQGTFMNTTELTDAQDKAHVLIDVAMTEKEAPDIEAQITKNAVAAGWNPDQLPPVLGFLVPYRTKSTDLPMESADIASVFHLGFLL